MLCVAQLKYRKEMKLSERREVRTFSNNDKLIRERREKIANNAVKVFLEKGFDKATIRDLGKACGMSSGSLYHYIGTKRDILHLINVNTNLGSESLRRFRSSLGDVSHAIALSESMARYFKVCDSQSEAILLFSREIYKFPLEDRRVLLEFEADKVSFFEQLLREGNAAGEFQVSKPTLVAHNILMYGHAWALRKWFLKRHYTLKEYTREQIRLMLELVVTKTIQTDRTG